MRSRRRGGHGAVPYFSGICRFERLLLEPLCDESVSGHAKTDPPPLGLATSVSLGLFCEPLIKHAAGDSIRAGQLQLGGVILGAVAALLRDSNRLTQLRGSEPTRRTNLTVVVDDGFVLIHAHPVADHERTRERPHITHTVFGAEGVQAGLLIDLAGDCLFKVFAGVNETGDEGKTVGVPLAVIRQQHALAVAAGHQRHDGRFNAGEHHLAGGGAADSLGAEGRLLTAVCGVAHVDEVVAACQGGGVVGAAFRVVVDRVVAETTGGGAHPRVVQVGGDLREGFVLAVEYVYLRPVLLCLATLLCFDAVGGGANHAARQDSVLGQRLGGIATGQVVQGSVVVEEGLSRAGDEQVAQRVSASGRVSISGRVFR